MFKTVFIMLPSLILALPLLGQTSTNFKLEEFVVNNGGHPDQGQVISSVNYAIKLDALGDSVSAVAVTNSSFMEDAGFVSSYLPPGEVMDLRFLSSITLAWSPDPSVGSYDLYRGSLTDLPESYGSPIQTGISDENTDDPDTPASGAGFFYLVTAENRLGEEGTMGNDSTGALRP